MRIKSEIETLFDTNLGLSDLDVDTIYTASESLLSDDIWKKFQLEVPDLTDFDDILFGDLDLKKDPDLLLDNDDPFRIHHDCMWAGHCVSKGHPADEHKKSPSLGIQLHHVSAPGVLKAPVKQQQQQQQQQPLLMQQQPVQPGRSVLLKTAIKTPAPLTTALAPPVPSPDSPPMSDDEENKNMSLQNKPMTQTLQLLNDAISEYDLDEDSDLCEYFGDGDGEDIVADPVNEDEEEEEEEEEDEEEEEVDQKPIIARFANDHCYFMEKKSSNFNRVGNLGIDTPSDSEEEEEEIDVVSVTEKLTNRMTYALPTNPSSRDRHQLQRTMATAISNKRLNPPPRIKTIMPLRKQPIIQVSPIKRRQENARGVKRSMQQQRLATTPGASPYKRKANYMHNSDSEPEPSEKRSMHNNMERQRRIDLRNAFEDLRMLVPEVSCKAKAAKVAILREAAQYCNHLRISSNDMMKQRVELKRQQERLRARVSQLRKSLAAKR